MNTNDNTTIHELVLKDIQQRADFGMKKYGVPLYPFDKRRTLQDAYEEVLDLAIYLRKEMEERKQIEEVQADLYEWLHESSRVSREKYPHTEVGFDTRKGGFYSSKSARNSDESDLCKSWGAGVLPHP